MGQIAQEKSRKARDKGWTLVTTGQSHRSTLSFFWMVLYFIVISLEISANNGTELNCMPLDTLKHLWMPGPSLKSG